MAYPERTVLTEERYIPVSPNFYYRCPIPGSVPDLVIATQLKKKSDDLHVGIYVVGEKDHIDPVTEALRQKLEAHTLTLMDKLELPYDSPRLYERSQNHLDKNLKHLLDQDCEQKMTHENDWPQGFDWLDKRLALYRKVLSEVLMAGKEASLT